MPTEINVNESANVPFIEGICDYSINFSSSLSLNSSSVQNSSEETGIILDCLPRLNGFNMQNSGRSPRLTVLRRTKTNTAKIVFVIPKNLANIKRVTPEIYDDGVKIENPIDLLSDLENKNSTTTTDVSIIKGDKSLNDIPYFPMEENKEIPDVVKILNNEIESIFLPENSVERQKYIHSLSYPVNYNNTLDLSLGTFLEPFSITNIIQFKEKQEKAFNKFHCDINTSYNSRGKNNYFTEKSNKNYQNEQIYFFDNINRSNVFIGKTENLKKSYVSPLSHVLLDDYTNNRIVPFFDMNYEERFKKNYINDDINFSFYDFLKNTNFYENFINDRESIKYEKYDKFSACGFDYSYNEGIGKNSIAFKGIE